MSEQDYVKDLLELFKAGVPKSNDLIDTWCTKLVGLTMAASCQRKTELEQQLKSDHAYFEGGEGRPWQWPDELAMGNDCHPWRKVNPTEQQWQMWTGNRGFNSYRWEEKEGIVIFYSKYHDDSEYESVKVPLSNMQVWYNPQNKVYRVLNMDSVQEGPFGPCAKEWVTISKTGEKAGYGPGLEVLWYKMMSYYTHMVNSLWIKVKCAGP